MVNNGVQTRTISQLPTATSISSGDQLVILQDNITKSATAGLFLFPSVSINNLDVAGNLKVDGTVSIGGSSNFNSPVHTKTNLGYVNAIDYLPNDALRTSVQNQSNTTTDLSVYMNKAVSVGINTGISDIYFAPGLWYTTNPVNINLASVSIGLISKGHINIRGGGPGSTIFQTEVSGGVSTAWGFDIIPGPTFGVNTLFQFSDCTLRGNDARPATNRGGINLRSQIHAGFTNVNFYEYNDGIHLSGIVQANFQNCSWNYCNHGFVCEEDVNSPTNELSFVGCGWTRCRNIGFKNTKGGNINMEMCSFEGTGLALQGIADEPVVASIYLDNLGYNANAAINFKGVHCESGRGNASIYVNTGSYGATYNLLGCDFGQNGNTNFVTNSVFVSATGGARQIFNTIGLGFSSGNGYVPSSGRKTMLFNGPGLLVTATGNYYGDKVEEFSPWIAYTPTLTAGAGTLTNKAASATYKWDNSASMIDIEGTIVVTSNGTGSANLQLTTPVSIQADGYGWGLNAIQRAPEIKQIMGWTSDSANRIIVTNTSGGYPVLVDNWQASFSGRYRVVQF